MLHAADVKPRGHHWSSDTVRCIATLTVQLVQTGCSIVLCLAARLPESTILRAVLFFSHSLSLSSCLSFLFVGRRGQPPGGCIYSAPVLSVCSGFRYKKHVPSMPLFAAATVQYACHICYVHMQHMSAVQQWSLQRCAATVA